MACAFLALGANLGDPPAQIAEAVTRLSAHPRIELISHSSVIITPPWGITDQPDFHNAAIVVETDLSPIELLDVCLETETTMGREREEKWGPRLIDIDIIAYDRLEQKTGRITLPHPHAHEREFVLGPLREIAPEIADWIVNRTA